MRFRTSMWCAVATMSIAAVAQAQQVVDYSKVEIRTTKLGDNFYALEAVGGPIIGTSTVLTGPDGVLMVDSQIAGVSDKLLAAVRKLSKEPVRFLINTHAHGDHTGGNENFARQGTLLFSRDQLRERLATPTPGANGAPGTPPPPKSLPVVTYDGPVTFHLNGQQVNLIPIRAAHTGGDTLISFPAMDALAVGDYFRTVGYPRVDRRGGGSLQGLLAGLGETIGRAGPNTRIIPGHGPITNRAGLIAQRDLILTIRDKVTALIAQGMTADQAVAAKPTAEFDAQVPESAESAEQFVRWMYEEVKASR